MANTTIPHAMSSSTSSRFRSRAGTRRRTRIFVVNDMGALVIAGASCTGVGLVLLVTGIREPIDDFFCQAEVGRADGRPHPARVEAGQGAERDRSLLVDGGEVNRSDVLLHATVDRDIPAVVANVV